MQISKDMLIGELVQMNEAIPAMLMRAGMHCLGCPASQGETVERACMVHGVDVNELLAKDNIKVELVEFAEYKLPNNALDAGEIDLNAFQHKAYLQKETDDLGYSIAILGDTIVAPLSLYSDKITDVSELKEGDKIAIPSDPTNEGRCFKILESAGLLEVDPAAGYVPELKDITANPLKLEFVEVEAANTASLLPDVAAAFVNGAHAIDNGLKIEDAVYTEQVEPGSDNPYINIIACRTDDLQNETYLKVLAAYQSAETAQAIKDIYKGLYIPASSIKIR